jgi:hypothetical protein
MGPHLVEVDQPSVARTLLATARSGWIQLQLTQITMHPFVSAVVLWTANPRTNQADSE